MKAEDLWSAEINIAPSVFGYTGIVRAQLQQNKLEEALANSKAMIAAFPAVADSYSTTGDVLFRAGLIPEASTAYAKALSIDQCSARAHFGWERISAAQSHRLAEAHELLDAHVLAPSGPEITAAWIESLPQAEHEAPLEALLGSSPDLAADQVRRLETDLAIDRAQAFCTPVSPVSTAAAGRISPSTRTADTP